MPISRRPSAAHERLSSLAAAPSGPRPSSAGWVPVPPVARARDLADVLDVPARRVLPASARAAPSDEVARTAARGAGAARRGTPGQVGRGRHRAGPADGGADLDDDGDGDHGAPGAGAVLVPVTLRGGRWAVSGRAALGALLAVAVLAATLALRAGTPDGGATLAPARPVSSTASASASGAAPVDVDADAAAAPPAATASGGPAAVAAPVAASGAALVVHVVGQVATPGLVTVADGSRVADALAAAGGATSTADLSGLNLARPVVDGEQLVVPLPGEVVVAPPGPPGGTGTPGTGQAAGPVDLNRADLAALDGLPGIGPVLAQRILDWRTEHGRFTSVDELGEVSGIGDTLLGRLRDAVTV